MLRNPENTISRFHYNLKDTEKYLERPMSTREVSCLKDIIQLMDKLLNAAAAAGKTGEITANLVFRNWEEIKAAMDLVSQIVKLDVELAHVGGYIEGGDDQTFDTSVFDFIISSFDPKSILDIGCAEGQNLKYFKDCGLKITGIEASEIAFTNSVLDTSVNEVLLHDYITGECTVFDGADVCLCSEFVEHVEERYIDNYIKDMKKCKTVVMTFAPPGQPGHHHVNCKPESYWNDVFKKHGFIKSEELTKKLRTEIATTYYWINTGIVFEKINE